MTAYIADETQPAEPIAVPNEPVRNEPGDIGTTTLTEPDSRATPPSSRSDSSTTIDTDEIPAETGQDACHRSLVDDADDHRPVRERLADAGVLYRVLVIGAAVILVVALAGRLRTVVST